MRVRSPSGNLAVLDETLLGISQGSSVLLKINVVYKHLPCTTPRPPPVFDFPQALLVFPAVLFLPAAVLKTDLPLGTEAVLESSCAELRNLIRSPLPYCCPLATSCCCSDKPGWGLVCARSLWLSAPLKPCIVSLAQSWRRRRFSKKNG